MTNEQRQHHVGWLGHLIGIDRVLAGQERIMSVLGDAIAAAAVSTGQAATDAANRVIVTFNEYVATTNAANEQIAALQAHGAEDDAAIAALQAEIEAGNITPEAAQAVLDTLAATKAVIDGIDATPIVPEEPVV